MPTSGVPRVSCRQIAAGDLERIAGLLANGFPERSRDYWLTVLNRLAERPNRLEIPRFGYLLEIGETAVGAVLLIANKLPEHDAPVRYNLSSWYVTPAFRAHAATLINHAMRRYPGTYVNLTADPNTWPTIEAQGFRRYSDGVFMFAPALSRGVGRSRARLVSRRTTIDDRMPEYERQLLLDHAGYGCISMWCEDDRGVHPFVFLRRWSGWKVPYAHLVYCRNSEDLVRLAAPIGRTLALRGLPLVMIDANEPLSGLSGHFIKNKMPRYYRGSQAPRVGDLSYTELSMFGV